MKLRYKSNKEEVHASYWNMHAMAEVLTGDDSVSINDLEAFIEAKGIWLDMKTAFAAKDIISDNYVEFFGEPQNKEDIIRGYFD